MSSSTLVSLAMLKVNIDQGRDYLDYLRPFILHILVDQKPDRVTDSIVREHLRIQFGLEIPERVVQIVLKRLARKYPLKKEEGIYRIMRELPESIIIVEKAKAERHINAVITGLMEFSKSTLKLFLTAQEAEIAFCAFLSKFEIPCLRAYLQGTAIPAVLGKQESAIVLVSRYVLQLQQSEPERFDSFMIMAQGHMLANALLCPDLQNAPKTYKGVSFYLDTPLLIRRIGAEGELRKDAVEELIRLLNNLGAKVATFSHSHDELEKVLRGAADHVERPDGRGDIVMEARRGSITKSDLLLLSGRIDEELAQAGIEVRPTPQYNPQFQIDEIEFEAYLDDEVSYYNPKAKLYDVNSIRCIYALRKRLSPSSVEKCHAILVTSNSGFAQAAWKFGQQYEASREVSTVITDFSLANMAWLKAPMGAPSLPTTEVLAFSYAALQPSKELLNKYLTEIDKLEKQGKITERDHQLLRSSILAQDEIMYLTLGDEKELTEETISETLRRVSNEIKKEEREKFFAEQEAHRKTKDELAKERVNKNKIIENIYWRCRRKAEIVSWVLSIIIVILEVAGLAYSWGVRTRNPILGWLLASGIAVLTLFTLLSLILGTTVKRLRQGVSDRCSTWFIKWSAASYKLDLAEYEGYLPDLPVRKG